MEKPDFSIEEYREYLIRSGRGPSSKTYYFTLVSFNRWLYRNREKYIDEVSSNDLSEYLHYVDNPNTANLVKAALKGYLKYRAGSYNMGDPRVNMEIQRISQIDLVKTPRIERKLVKEALTPKETKMVLESIEESDLPEVVHSLAVLSAYFGWRPIEAESYLGKSKIKWKDNSVVIRTAKTGNERFLCWDDNITPFIEHVTMSSPISYPGQYMTKKLYLWQKQNKKPIVKGVPVMARTFRKTFQTNERLVGVQDMYIDYILGHESRGSKIGDVYTDFTQFQDAIRDIMTTEKHYMIKYKII